MANINQNGNITARCPDCGGALSTFTQRDINHVVMRRFKGGENEEHFRLFICSGCGMGALAKIQVKRGGDYPTDLRRLLVFFPESSKRLKIPDSVPEGIRNEFKEAESCIEARCYRAAGALFRSVLDKAFRANGYSSKTLYKMIEAAAKDNVITAARKKRAHMEIRVMGNDILHEKWYSVGAEDVEEAHHYCQRVLEDFYDERESVEELLKEAGRSPEEDIVEETEAEETEAAD